MKFLFIYLVLSSFPWSANLLFKSSFEEGVYLGKVERKESTVWWQSLMGSDNDEFTWPIRLAGEEGEFQMIIHNQEIDSYIKNSLEYVKGIDGKKSRVLHQVVKKKDKRYSQDPYVVYTKNKEQKEIYLRYTLKYPKNLAEKLGKNGWLTFCQYKTASDYRLSFYIYTDENKKLYWYVHEDNVVVDDIPYKEYWFRENRSNVKQGEWFDVEIYWYRSKFKNGRVWLAIDGRVLIDYRGRTMLDEPIHEMMLFTNYANGPLEQWVDNLEIWDTFPCGKGKSCNKKVRIKR